VRYPGPVASNYRIQIRGAVRLAPVSAWHAGFWQGFCLGVPGSNSDPYPVVRVLRCRLSFLNLPVPPFCYLCRLACDFRWEFVLGLFGWLRRLRVSSGLCSWNLTLDISSLSCLPISRVAFVANRKSAKNSVSLYGQRTNEEYLLVVPFRESRIPALLPFQRIPRHSNCGSSGRSYFAVVGSQLYYRNTGSSI
jgi:hypothetical protein